ncbi:unnamed protein product [Timema podura]|uniref:DNA-(apurinic or apyrimidinic site) lyase n=1 Tax=Timema podura TaxID=61482 RepID=A0ABN7NGB7_TIMPD|nr:unnamed protein product [Timema podura]
MEIWRKLPCLKSDLQLLFTLTGGQCFRWKKTGKNEWTGVFSSRIWILSQDDTHLLYKVILRETTDPVASPKQRRKGNARKRVVSKLLENEGEDYTSEKDPRNMQEKCDSNSYLNKSVDDEELLKKYLRLDEPLQDLYELWSKKDLHFKQAAVKFQGLRILAQDPTENLFSFICSSNNNISRISSMVEKLCTLYGTRIATVDNITYFDFPHVSALTDPSVEQSLREAGFGYRAKFIHKSACQIIKEGGVTWLQKLQTLPYEEAKTELMKLPGIGAKVADCICLMSLGHLDAIPVDTHIYQVAAQRYLPHLKNYKSVTNKVYNEIGEYFRDLYEKYAGWAHTIIFCADLKMFQEDASANTKVKGKSIKVGTKRKQPS